MARTRYSILSCEVNRENSSADNGCNGCFSSPILRAWSKVCWRV